MRKGAVQVFRRSRHGHYKSPPYLRAGAAMIVVLIGIVVLCLAAFRGAFQQTVQATVVSDRSGLVMEPGSKVKLHGVEVGKVTAVSLSDGKSEVGVELDPSKVALIPSNVEAEIKPTTVFGSKYIELVVPGSAAPSHLRAGARIRALNVSTEINTVFQNVTAVMNQIEPDKLNATLAAVEEGLHGRGARFGETLTDADKVLTALNPVLPQLRADLHGTADVANNLGDSADDIMRILRAASVTSGSIVDRKDDLAAALDAATELGKTGNDTLAGDGQRIVDTFRLLTPTTGLLDKYSPSFTCLLHLGAHDAEAMGKTIDATGYSARLDVGLLMGDDPYKYPDNLPVVAGKGGPHGSPGCYAPVTWDTYPAPYLRLNDGAPLDGPGTDHPRPANPTIVDYMFGFTVPGGGR
ncbi:MCE family protein [Nocardia sp. BSTN01]|nr:MCE family protein [Nocardia sp. BSTN01]